MAKIWVRFPLLLISGILVALLLQLSQSLHRELSNGQEPWTLPALPKRVPDGNVSDFNGKRIPRDLWMTFRKIPTSDAELKDHLQSIFKKHKAANWTVHLYNDDMMNAFMNDKFSNTSLLWAYNMIHPRLGVARADIWRYAITWYYGGVYMDDDSNLGNMFDDVFKSGDGMIVGVEKNRNDDACYQPQYRLSVTRLKARFPSKDPTAIFGNHILVNWLFFAEPGSVVLANTIVNMVDLIRHEYLGKSVLRPTLQPKWMHVMCITGPRMLTASSTEAILRYDGKEHDLVEVKGGYDFKLFGGSFKLWDEGVPQESHYMSFMVRENINLLHSYLPQGNHSSARHSPRQHQAAEIK